MRLLAFLFAALILSLRTVGAQEATPPTKPDSVPAALSDAQLARVHQQIAEFEKSKRVFKWGLSIGWRHIQAPESSLLRNAVLQEGTDTVRVAKIDRGAVVVSGAVVAYPWTFTEEAANERIHRGRLGFIANIAVASFGQDKIASFNESVEGGIGLAYRVSQDFALAATVERVFSRRLRGHIVPDAALPPLPPGATRDFSVDNDQYFHDDNLTAWSFKFVYFFR